MEQNEGKKPGLNALQSARNSWQHNGTTRPPFAIEPKKGQRSVWDFPRPPMIEKTHKPILVEHKGEKIASCNAALSVLETASPPTYYIPEHDIDMNSLLKLTGKTSMCEWKGVAVYWALRTKADVPVAWSYPNPYPEFMALKNHIAFYPQHLDCSVEGNRVKAQNSAFYAGWITPDLTGPFKGEIGTGHW